MKKTRLHLRPRADWEPANELYLVWPGSVQDHQRRGLEEFYLNFISLICKHTRATVRCITGKNHTLPLPEECANRVQHLQLDDTRGLDLWLRDFMPLVCADKNNLPVFCRPRFRPGYLPVSQAKKMEALAGRILETFSVTALEIPLVLDGGNFITNGTNTMLTTKRTVWDNEYDPDHVIHVLKQFFPEYTAGFLDEEPGDPLGHLDGYIRLIAPDIVALASYPESNRAMKDFMKQIRDELPRVCDAREIIEIPCDFLSSGTCEGIPSAMGNRINYFRWHDTFFVPVYGCDGDDKALEALSAFGTAVPVDASALSEYGGVLNCITWSWYNTRVE